MTRFARASTRTTLILAGALLTLAATARGPEDSAEDAFARATIDVGVVVSDIEASLAFYRDALGFQEAPGFSVDADFCRAAGLTEGHPLDVRVLVLGDSEDATRLKLMAVPGAGSSAGKNEFIHSQLGLSYLTVFLKDLSGGLARAKQHGVEPVAKGPVPLDASAPEGMGLALVRDPDGNWVELLGPR